MTIKIEVKNLSKIFGRNPKAILEKLKKGIKKEEILRENDHTVGIYDINFEVAEGEVFVIMGLSGSGKSTLIRCLNLLNKPTAGHILVDNVDITKLSAQELREFRQKKIAMVFQNFGLLTHRTVLGNVEYGLEVRGIPKAERQEIAQKNLEIVGLGEWGAKNPAELSGGMKQRVGLARALANDPDILLMDEPFSALDPLIRRDMQSELLDLQSKLQKTIVFITHDINEAFKLGDRVAVMRDGIIEQIGTPEEILENPAGNYVAEFIQDVDKSKVLQAKNVMIKPNAVVSSKDGPKVAVKEMQNNGISSVFVVDEGRRLKGLITIDDTLKAINERKALSDIWINDYCTVEPEASLQDLIPIATHSKYPIAVVDETGRFVGIILRVTVLAAL